MFLAFNLVIALVLMEANMFDFLNTILGFYANCGMAWIVVVASDIVFNKYLLKLSPKAPSSAAACCTPSTRSASCRWPRRRGVSILVFFGGLGDTIAVLATRRDRLGFVLPILAVATGVSTTCAVRTTDSTCQVRRPRQPVGRRTDLSRVPTGLRAAGHDRVPDARRGCVLALSQHRQGVRPRPPGRAVNFTPAETEKLLLAGMVARDRLARESGSTTPKRSRSAEHWCSSAPAKAPASPT